ncbi:hypothetical protein PAPYR_5406 [Paratrimastix pyriformis]|uniref:Uncharacterized protein n=1 Tax=Paratrimastix pyriformis TaxID=342808 RepID=A0ABQ8UI14_9EUKA|nr:hypothetical protein PAPYR_5406 [Paratrimastix pyriformis]
MAPANTTAIKCIPVPLMNLRGRKGYFSWRSDVLVVFSNGHKVKLIRSDRVPPATTQDIDGQYQGPSEFAPVSSCWVKPPSLGAPGEPGRPARAPWLARASLPLSTFPHPVLPHHDSVRVREWWDLPLILRQDLHQGEVAVRGEKQATRETSMKFAFLCALFLTVAFAAKKEITLREMIKGSWNVLVEHYDATTGESVGDAAEFGVLELLNDNVTMKFSWFINSTEGEKKDEREIRVVFPESRFEAEVYAWAKSEVEPATPVKLMNLNVQTLSNKIFSSVGTLATGKTYQLTMSGPNVWVFTVFDAKAPQFVTVYSASKTSVQKVRLTFTIGLTFSLLQPQSFFQRFQLSFMMLGVYFITKIFGKKQQQQPEQQQAPAAPAAPGAPAPAPAAQAEGEGEREHHD